MTRLFKFLWQFYPRLNAAREQLGAKGWYRSKTIWVNLLGLASATAVYWLGPQYGISEAEIVAVATGVTNIVNIVLRLITYEPVAARDELPTFIK